MPSLYIDGEWREASDDGSIPVNNPVTEEVITDIDNASDSDVNAALAAAERRIREA